MTTTPIVITPELEKLSGMRLILDQAQQFLRAYEVLADHEKKNTSGTSETGHADIINLSFSIELLLKALLFGVTGKKVMGHEMEKLFMKLPPNWQNDVKLEVNNQLIQRSGFQPGFQYSSFDQMLTENSNAFVDWRYLYERGFAGFNYQFCLHFAYAIKSLAEKLRDDLLKICIQQHAEGKIQGIPLN